jgi:poly-gamma-glutamate synthesis protein (capsule biosynthesis protein)
VAAVHPDLIVMHHPHTVQPIEQVDGTWVFWSVGNFVSGMGPGYGGRYSSRSTLDGIVAQATFTEDVPGHFTVTPSAVAICTIQTTRYVYPATLTLARTDITASLRRRVTDCLKRTRAVIPSVL